ncbi:hypothetical protein M8C21_030152, partial [Ambrosia artemisiifolia]
QRHQICLGAARGLEYLHSGDESVNSNPCIIHGNLKLSKILLNNDAVSSNFEAKVSGFGLPKLLPGHVEIGPRTPEKLTKESDVYSFGVILLEVLCGVPELVDTDDYQERHVAELVPKRLEQNMLRKIVHFDIRDEITTESLETYAKIACQCVRENPEERPTMSEVVIELEKALRLQGGKVSDVQIFGSSGIGQPDVAVGEDDHEGETMRSDITEEEPKRNEETTDVNDKDINLGGKVSDKLLASSNGNGLSEVPVGEDDQEGDDNGETMSSTITEEESKEDAEKENVNVPNGTEETTVDLNSNEESKIVGENKVNDESKITTSSSSYANEPLPDERSATKEKGKGLMMMNTHNPDIMEVQNSAVSDSNGKAGSLNTEKPEVIINDRGGDYSNSAIQIQESESKRSNSTCSESSNVDDTAASDYLLPKSPDNVGENWTDLGQAQNQNMKMLDPRSRPSKIDQGNK